MSVFVDTSAFLAVLNLADQYHPSARATWSEILSSDHVLFTSNYVILETMALLQHRFGMDAVRLFETDISPVVEVIWIDSSIHNQGMSAMLASNQRRLSLVDCTSFVIVRQYSLDAVFTFDVHFHRQGFNIIPEIL